MSALHCSLPWQALTRTSFVHSPRAAKCKLHRTGPHHHRWFRGSGTHPEPAAVISECFDHHASSYPFSFMLGDCDLHVKPLLSFSLTSSFPKFSKYPEEKGTHPNARIQVCISAGKHTHWYTIALRKKYLHVKSTLDLRLMACSLQLLFMLDMHKNHSVWDSFFQQSKKKVHRLSSLKSFWLHIHTNKDRWWKSAKTVCSMQSFSFCSFMESSSSLQNFNWKRLSFCPFFLRRLLWKKHYQKVDHDKSLHDVVQLKIFLFSLEWKFLYSLSESTKHQASQQRFEVSYCLSMSSASKKWFLDDWRKDTVRCLIKKFTCVLVELRLLLHEIKKKQTPDLCNCGYNWFLTMYTNDIECIFTIIYI